MDNKGVTRAYRLTARSLLYVGKLVLVVLLILVLVGAGLFRSEIPVDSLKGVYGGEPSRFVTVLGMDIHYRDQGSVDSVPLVLLHGAFSSLHTWEAWSEELRTHRRVISLDLPGFGLTGPDPSGDYSMERSVEVLHGFLHAIGALDGPGGQIHVGGNSLGGQIAWSYAARYPENTASLLLVGASGYSEYTTPPPALFRYVQAVASMEWIAAALTRFTPRFLFRWNLRSAFGDAARITDDLVTRYYQLLRREGNRSAFLLRLVRSLVPESTEQLATIQAPTLILWGELDSWIPLEHGFRFHNDIPNSQLVILPGVGHVPMEETPVESAELVGFFLNEALPGLAGHDQENALPNSSL